MPPDRVYEHCAEDEDCWAIMSHDPDQPSCDEFSFETTVWYSCGGATQTWINGTREVPSSSHCLWHKTAAPLISTSTKDDLKKTYRENMINYMKMANANQQKIFDNKKAGLYGKHNTEMGIPQEPTPINRRSSTTRKRASTGSTTRRWVFRRNQRQSTEDLRQQESGPLREAQHGDGYSAGTNANQQKIFDNKKAGLYGKHNTE